jgi:hypothetical protein
MEIGIDKGSEPRLTLDETSIPTGGRGTGKKAAALTLALEEVSIEWI